MFRCAYMLIGVASVVCMRAGVLDVSPDTKLPGVSIMCQRVKVCFPRYIPDVERHQFECFLKKRMQRHKHTRVVRVLFARNIAGIWERYVQKHGYNVLVLKRDRVLDAMTKALQVREQ